MLSSGHRALKSLRVQDVCQLARSLTTRTVSSSLNRLPRTTCISIPKNGTGRILNKNSRFLSSSLEEVKDEAFTKKDESKPPQHHPSRLDRFTLIFTRTMKASEIGSEVSHSSMEKANTKRRIMVNLFLMVFTLVGSIYSIRKGKRDKKTDNIYEINKRR